MKTDCPVVFANSVAVSGFSNGVVNLALSTASFTPKVEGEKVRVETNEFISANLRFDLYCAQQIRDALDQIIERNTKPASGVN